ncbi:preprotein translocase subunit SecA [Helicobacter sp. MIT 99-5507]|uniref:preprotein translocase subunit SecA n=1 Tax=Helicobacter sp. MIT 99-5507 TaxID=152489 RepID=UPI000E1F485C|nr:preprotein translocase subunit SecA [Helicobacter sp. MIT 99-5507]RDU58250.1 preprotein translocase subunit SecA [Helicobacter sp. MIT 99-5507]
MIQNIFNKLLGTRNQRMLNKYKQKLNAINNLESKYQNFSDDELKAAFNTLKENTKNKFDEIGQGALDSVLIESFAITREASKRVLNMRHFDVQLIGGMVLHEGKIAEMKTGEGKTLVATLAVILNAMIGKSVHVVTVNDYLARRDATEMGALYEFLGYSVGIITGDERDEESKLKQYSCDIIYGTNNEFGFDYLRDNMKFSLSNQFQKDHFFAIVDEVDSILIDEARTPLIISGPANRKLENYGLANSVAQKMTKDIDFSIDEKNRTILIAESGIKKAEEIFKVDNLYNIENAFLAHHLDQALKANFLFQKDKDYIVRDGEVIIVDEFTGRLSEGRRFSDGLHQAIEAKELVDIKEETQTLADITFQNYFRMYEKLSGMTGTAQTEASEFLQIYKLDVVSIPTNVPNIRKDYNDLIFKSEAEKFDAVCKKIVELHKSGIPVLIGTASIEKSEKLHELLKKQRIPHTVLNAKQHTKEAEIIKDAGKIGAVTIATNMAGRGVDIKIDKEVADLGGLFIIGTERHESRRIDNQLRGRSGRQGDPGASQFYLSLEDNLLRIFGSDKIKGIMEKLGLKDGEHIESSFVTRSIENAQKKVESLHFETRKHILEYDDVANEQRKIIYQFRNKLLDENYDLSQKIKEDREFSIQNVFLNLDFMQDNNIDKVGISNKILEDFGSKIVFEDSTDDISLLQEQANIALTNDYEAKMKPLTDTQRKDIERIVYLQVLDNAWREHLYTMDNLKTGIGLRGYNQKDPLIEYKKESYNLFLEFKDNLKIESSKMIHMIKLREQSRDDEEQAKAMLKHLEEENNDDISFNKDGNNDEIKKSTKVARNDPCPCGSGKKYKLCHGKSGPKKGILAN